MSDAPLIQMTPSGLAFRTFGAAEAPCLVLTHGAFLDQTDFDTIASRLARRFRVLTWDLPGHGASTLAMPNSLSGVSAALADVTRSAGVTRAVHIGFSFGGMAAQAFARSRPHETRALVAYGCVPIYDMPRMPALTRWLAITAVKLQPWASFCQTFAAQASVSPALQAEIDLAMRRQGPALRDAIWSAMINGVVQEPAFRFACPVGQIRGSLDDRFPGAADAMARLSRILPPTCVRVIEGAGHVAHAEQPEAFVQALDTLLDTLSAHTTP